MKNLLIVLVVTFVASIALSACAPIGCPGGYANQNWCHAVVDGGDAE